MKKSFYILLAIFILACQKQQFAYQYEVGEMRIDASYPGISTKATESGFEEGDKIGLYVVSYEGEVVPPLQISGNWANNIATTYENNLWLPAKKIFWGEGLMDVYGYYPYMELISVDDQPFQVALDQSIPVWGETSMSAYEASDLLWAKAEGVSAEEDNAQVHLAFRHIMSKLIVKLVKGPDYQGVFPDEAEMFVHSLVPKALVDLAKGEAIKDPYGNVGVIKGRQVSSDTFEFIIVPQRIDSRRPFIEYIANGVSFLLEDTFNFRPGMQYTLNLTINSNPDQIAIEIGAETGEW